MKKVLLIAGSDSIELDSLRFACGQIPEVMAEIEYAQDILQHAGVNVDLLSFMRQPKRNTGEWFHKLTLTTIPVHVALYKLFVKNYGIPNVILSCSLGDVSRNVCIGATDFEESLLGMHDFATAFTQMKNGQSIHAIFPLGYQEHHLESLAKYDLAVSIFQTPFHLLIGGDFEKAQMWAETEAVGTGVKLKTLYPYPLHTSLMTECYQRVHERVTNTKMTEWKNVEVYSAVERKFIRNTGELRVELKQNIISAVHWDKSVRALNQHFGGDVQFYNMGPTPSLSYFHKKTLGSLLSLTDAFSPLVAKTNDWKRDALA